MKQYHYIKLLSLLCVMAVVSLSSCREDFDYETAYGGKQYAEKCAQYEEAFVTEFCDGASIAPDHNWGFTALPSVEELKTKAATRSAFPNSNEWANTYNVPADITDAERQAVFEYVKAHSTENSIDINYTEFFVQQVWKGQDVYKDGYNNDVYASDKMNELTAGAPSAMDVVNNFNNGNGSIMLMVNSGTSYFAYKNSQDGGNYYDVKNTDYKIFNIPDYGYYVCFDFQAHGQNPNEKVAADGIFTDWIVKIVPATRKDSDNNNTGNEQPAEDPEYNVSLATMRIMCEDLGRTDEFDFNDVVFDVEYITNKKAKITVQAAGGKLPIYIGDRSLGNEIHALYGVSLSTMVNTNRSHLKGFAASSEVIAKDPVTFYIDVKSTNPNDIPVYVGVDQETGYELSANEGVPPQKICVPTEVDWSNETFDIYVLYPKFRDWVQDPNVKFWESTPQDNNNNVVNSGNTIWSKGFLFSGWSDYFLDREEITLSKLAVGKKLRFNFVLKVPVDQHPEIVVRLGSWGATIIEDRKGLQAGSGGYESEKTVDVTVTSDILNTLETCGSKVFTISGMYFGLNSIEVVD